MASDESSTMVSSSILDDDFEVTDEGLQYQTRHSSLSRLSVCTSSLHDDEDDDTTTNNPSELGTFMSGLSLESFDGAEADGEVSDVDKGGGGGKEEEEDDGGWSDSDKEPRFYSLPATPSRRRRKLPAEETKCNTRRQRRGAREKRPPWMGTNQSCNSDGGGGGGVMVKPTTTTKTKGRGGKRSLRMDMEEVKACRDLGFELDPGRVSVSGGSTLETQTSSGGNSPVATWRISSPGDDPREVKARLKVWAQAVALASASHHPS